MTEDEFDALVAWQMRRRPTDQRLRPVEKCRWCGMEWHGLPKNNCEGSFVGPADTPKPDSNSAAS